MRPGYRAGSLWDRRSDRCSNQTDGINGHYSHQETCRTLRRRRQHQRRGQDAQARQEVREAGGQVARGGRPRRRARHRRVAHQGKDDRQISRRRLRRARHHRTCARPPDARAGRRRRKRLSAEVRDHQRKDQDAGRPEEGGQDGDHDLSRHRPRSGGGGDRLARRRPAQLDGADPPRPLSRDHEGCDPGRDAEAAADRQPEGERAAGAPHPGPPGRIQGESDPLAHHQDGPERGPGADRGVAPARGARARDPRLRAE